MVYFPGATLNDRFRGGETSRGRGAAAPEPLLSLLEGRIEITGGMTILAFHMGQRRLKTARIPVASESLVMDLSCVRGKSRFHFVLNMPLSGVTAVMGESGAGKTTFSQLIAGLIRPTEGSCGSETARLRIPIDTSSSRRINAAFPWCSRIIVCSRTSRSAGI